MYFAYFEKESLFASIYLSRNACSCYIITKSIIKRSKNCAQESCIVYIIDSLLASKANRFIADEKIGSKYNGHVME